MHTSARSTSARQRLRVAVHVPMSVPCEAVEVARRGMAPRRLPGCRCCQSPANHAEAHRELATPRGRYQHPGTITGACIAKREQSVGAGDRRQRLHLAFRRASASGPPSPSSSRLRGQLSPSMKRRGVAARRACVFRNGRTSSQLAACRPSGRRAQTPRGHSWLAAARRARRRGPDVGNRRGRVKPQKFQD